MAGWIRNSCARAARAFVIWSLAASVAFCAAAKAAEVVRPGEELTYDADVVSSDFRTDTLEISGNVRVTQGPTSIQAGAATGNDFRSENSRWSFKKAVRIVTSEAELQADSASATAVGGQIARARAEGSPAQFAQRGNVTERQNRGHAGVIEYDFVAGVVKLTNQVWFTNGRDEFTGDVVIYNVRDERLESSGPVRGIIRPRQGTSTTTTPPKTSTQPETGG